MISKYSKDNIKQINAEKKVAYFLASTCYPYNMVYCHQFRELSEYLENKFTIPGKLKLTNHALKIEEEMMENIKNLLKDQIYKVLLGLQVFNDRHTEENVKNIVQKVFNSYNYDFDQIIRIITDDWHSRLDI